MQLITFLGTGKYISTTYTWQDQQKSTRFVADALCDFFSPQEVKVFVTPEAKKTHWDDLRNNINSEITVSTIDIPSGQQEAEIWEIFAQVVNSVDPNSEVIFDITHAFRSIPLLVLLASAFLQKARNVKIKGVYYGAFNFETDTSPVVDLTPAIKLLDWLTATDKFMTTGSSVELGNLLEKIQRDFYTQSNPVSKKKKSGPTKLQNFGNSIRSISNSLELIRPIDLMDQAAKIQTIPLEQLQEEVGFFAQPFSLLLEGIHQDYSQFALSSKERTNNPLEIPYKLFLQIQWYVEKRLGGQAIILAREWVVSTLTIAENLNYLERDDRMIVEKQLNTMSLPDGDLQQVIVRHVNDPKKLAAFWSQLTNYRNDIAHCQMRQDSIRADVLQRYVENDLLNSLKEIFPRFTQLIYVPSQENTPT